MRRTFIVFLGNLAFVFGFALVARLILFFLELMRTNTTLGIAGTLFLVVLIFTGVFRYLEGDQYEKN